MSMDEYERDNRDRNYMLLSNIIIATIRVIPAVIVRGALRVPKGEEETKTNKNKKSEMCRVETAETADSGDLLWRPPGLVPCL